MDIKINKRGNLEIKRGEKYKKMMCPKFQDETACGDWCPFFGEPTEEIHFNNSITKESYVDQKAELGICKKTFELNENFIDEREEK